MIARLLSVGLALALAAAIAGGLYWQFLNTPESQTSLVALSGLLVLLVIVVLTSAVPTAILLALGQPWKASVVRGLRHFGWCAVIGAVAIGGVFLVQRVDAWVAEHSGEISAWFIARFNAGDITWLFNAEAYLSAWLRWVVIPVLAVAAATSILQRGLAGLMSTGWLRGAWHWRTLLVATLAYVVLVALPWNWFSTPIDRTAGGMELPLAIGRAGVVTVAIVLGASVALLTTAHATRARVQR